MIDTNTEVQCTVGIQLDICYTQTFTYTTTPPLKYALKHNQKMKNKISHGEVNYAEKRSKQDLRWLSSNTKIVPWWCRVQVRVRAIRVIRGRCSCCSQIYGPTTLQQPLQHLQHLQHLQQRTLHRDKVCSNAASCAQWHGPIPLSGQPPAQLVLLSDLGAPVKLGLRRILSPLEAGRVIITQVNNSIPPPATRLR